MKKSRNVTWVTNVVIIILLILSFNFLALGTLYYVFDDHIEEFRYSDIDEYTSINEGLSIIKSLPIQFNITNQYFSGFQNLKNDVRESIIVGYMLKNKISTYACGNGNICIDKSSFNNEIVQRVFHTNTEIKSNSIKLFVDDYGNHSINTTSTSPYYRIVLNHNNHNYRKYTKFYKYKEEGDLVVFYVYEGFYEGNCIKGEKLELFDFMTGDKVYENICNGANGFEVELTDFSNLQLYKYELKKDRNNQLYLYGYNPVNK